MGQDHTGDALKGPKFLVWIGNPTGTPQADLVIFMDCIELHKLTIFAVDATKMQRYYMQQSVKKPQRVPVRQYMARMGLLNDYLAYLPTVKDSLKAVKDTKRGNVPFDEADLASIFSSCCLPRGSISTI